MFTVILRSALVGIVTVVAVAPAACFVGAIINAYSHPGTAASSGEVEVGWDLVTMAHNSPVAVILTPLIVFLIGFLFGLRYFSRALAKK